MLQLSWASLILRGTSVAVKESVNQKTKYHSPCDKLNRAGKTKYLRSPVFYLSSLSLTYGFCLL